MKRKCTISVLIAAIGLCVFPLAGYGAEPVHLKINCTIHSPYETFFFRLLEEVCSQNDISVKRNTPPVGRSLILVNEGMDDGDGPRIAGLSATYPNMICVPEPFGDFVFGAFAKRRDIILNDWNDLADLNVAYITGWKIFDRNVTQAKSIIKVKDKNQLFRLLEAGRTDVVLISMLPGYATIEKLGLKGIRFIDPPLAIKPNFLYLNKRHKDLAPKLAQTLRELKQNGTYERLYREMVSPYLPKGEE